MATTKMSLKLLIDTKANKVIFAEAGKDFVDFLFGLLSMPVGAIIKLLASRPSSVGCLGNVYRSLKNLNESYMQPNLSKDILLDPKVSASADSIPLLMADSVSTTTNKFYLCPNCFLHVANASNVVCPRCRMSLTRELTYVGKNYAVSTSGVTTQEGYVRGPVVYMVSDDLSVTPMSMISGIQLLNKLNISQLNRLEERVVEIGIAENLGFILFAKNVKSVGILMFLSPTSALRVLNCYGLLSSRRQLLQPHFLKRKELMTNAIAMKLVQNEIVLNQGAITDFNQR